MVADAHSAPPCPVGGLDADHEVRAYAGAGGGRITYSCTCGHVWAQKPPSKLLPGEDPQIRASNRAALGGATRNSRTYLCGVCGVPKKGHVCGQKRQKVAPAEAAHTDAPVSERRLEQFDDLLRFSTPPTDTEMLAFLRKYDLRPSEATSVYAEMLSYHAAAQTERPPIPVANAPPDPAPPLIPLTDLIEGIYDTCAECDQRIADGDVKICDCGNTRTHRSCSATCLFCASQIGHLRCVHELHVRPAE